ncbi:copper chaperone PCu(A)C [Falsirhodobacter algicola]|uniref:Copper chaperone PCu(A)C n=1 Tax=Falsirhodobacter algicola TaxID=2692330 RepID=A0A8J8MVP1_9RHOB|nr:copper chaperone PCu(A)C [Falsirhodobacter algicola]QUS37282.1 copper chaperone PCu(A)C [Falsirhodobacter algicola]
MFRTILTAAALLLAAPAFAHDGPHAMVEVAHGFARATLPGAPVGGAYLDLINRSDSDDRLTSVESAAAGRVDLHRMEMSGDTMRMAPMRDGLPLPAGETVSLSPSGMHLMLQDLAAPLREGETLTLELHFEHAAPVTVDLPILAPNADEAPMHHMH